MEIFVACCPPQSLRSHGIEDELTQMSRVGQGVRQSGSLCPGIGRVACIQIKHLAKAPFYWAILLGKRVMRPGQSRAAPPNLWTECFASGGIKQLASFMFWALSSGIFRAYAGQRAVTDHSQLVLSKILVRRAHDHELWYRNPTRETRQQSHGLCLRLEVLDGRSVLKTSIVQKPRHVKPCVATCWYLVSLKMNTRDWHIHVAELCAPAREG